VRRRRWGWTRVTTTHTRRAQRRPLRRPGETTKLKEPTPNQGGSFLFFFPRNTGMRVERVRALLCRRLRGGEDCTTHGASKEMNTLRLATPITQRAVSDRLPGKNPLFLSRGWFVPRIWKPKATPRRHTTNVDARAMSCGSPCTPPRQSVQRHTQKRDAVTLLSRGGSGF
jgi:hypothetical protein